ncbi:hypothetical protein McanMca71_001666 [Microsporum canis]|uniref:Uncharacterized protein n=1 Tax=Arthroderma otae (strain ATCC MYA-4605 / CBS 113480) TaxID=554155 RepID=C5FQC6_ARTOC|nr:uncharacterized protein MCYG_04898 [Microsporum canis CBS 113480]EEQ32079.1 predicted protein [Microsporum canis CBS 113480]
MRLLAKTECDHGRAGGRPRKEVSIQRLSTPDKNGLGVKDLGLDGPYGLPFYLENYGTVIRCTPGDGIFAQLRALAEAYKSSRARTKRIKLVLLTNEFNEQLRKWIQSILDDEDLHTSLLDLCIYGPNAITSSKISSLGRRVNVVHDVPNCLHIHSYGVKSVKRFLGYKLRFFELDYQLPDEDRYDGGVAA